MIKIEVKNGIYLVFLRLMIEFFVLDYQIQQQRRQLVDIPIIGI